MGRIASGAWPVDNRAAPPSRLALEAAAAGAVEIRLIGTFPYGARVCRVGIYLRPLGEDFTRNPQARRLIRTVNVDLNELASASGVFYPSAIDPAPLLREADVN